MINKRLSLILLAIVVVIEVVTLIFMRGDHGSAMGRIGSCPQGRGNLLEACRR